MKKITHRARVAAAGFAALAATGVGVAAAATAPVASNAMHKGVGVNEYGMTQAYLNGRTVSFTYTQGFYCDRHVAAAATSGCEVGAPFKVAPAKSFDPLYITVPLGFTAPTMSMDCPTGLVCVDHPGTIDLSRLESALKGLYPNLSAAQLTAALKNTAVPGHQHFITTANMRQPEWWNVDVVGVTSLKEWNTINAHKSFKFLNQQVQKKMTTGILPTNLFLYFGVN
jgi:hypothetical protein